VFRELLRYSPLSLLDLVLIVVTGVGLHRWVKVSLGWTTVAVMVYVGAIFTLSNAPTAPFPTTIFGTYPCSIEIAAKDDTGPVSVSIGVGLSGNYLNIAGSSNAVILIPQMYGASVNFHGASAEYAMAVAHRTVTDPCAPSTILTFRGFSPDGRAKYPAVSFRTPISKVSASTISVRLPTLRLHKTVSQSEEVPGLSDPSPGSTVKVRISPGSSWDLVNSTPVAELDTRGSSTQYIFTNGTSRELTVDRVRFDNPDAKRAADWFFAMGAVLIGGAFSLAASMYVARSGVAPATQTGVLPRAEGEGKGKGKGDMTRAASAGMRRAFLATGRHIRLWATTHVRRKGQADNEIAQKESSAEG
jgi:hypothetical protein